MVGKEPFEHPSTTVSAEAEAFSEPELNSGREAIVRTVPAPMMAGLLCSSPLSAETQSPWRPCFRMVQKSTAKSLKADGSSTWQFCTMEWCAKIGPEEE